MSGKQPSPLADVRDHYDVIVAGARVAGASTAMLLARSGMNVLVVDPVPPDRDALSTHALMRAGVLQLHRWGLLDEIRSAGTPRVHTTVFHYGDDAVAIPLKDADGIDGLYAPRRTVLDPVLRRAAARAGATLVHGAAVTGLLRGAGERVEGAVVSAGDGTVKQVRADMVIGADGINSRVARLVRAKVEHEERHAAASVYGYWPNAFPGEYHWLFGSGGSAGAISTNDGSACVFVLLPADAFHERRGAGLEAIHRETMRIASPELADLVAGGQALGKLHAFAGKPGFMRRPYGSGWALVGDAGYFKDPATAHGITDALRDAELLARAVLEGTDAALRVYHETRDDAVRAFMTATDRIASFDWDMAELQELHITLSRAMNVGLDVVRGMGPLGSRPPVPA